ncbi:MAG: MBL fold metallo-hydrolase [Bacteroidetes bacterium]|nr:MBL fold metallo-hydrolase [Bacteroidota bacterium]
MRIGDYTLAALETGRFYLDGGAMFGVVPKVLWEKSNPADARNRIEMAARTLLIRDGKRCIIVDTGFGDGWDPKFSDIYGIDLSKYSLANSLSRVGLSPADVTDVILTHLHFDHVGGASFRDKNGTVKPTFPNATYYVQKRQYEWAIHPSDKDQASYRNEKYVPLFEQGKLKLLDGESELHPGVFIRLTDGHTIAHQTILVTDGNKTLCHPGDTVPTSSHIPLPYIMGYDNYPLITLEEKKNILRRAVEGDWVLFFEHDPKFASTLVEKTDKGYKTGKPVDLNSDGV